MTDDDVVTELKAKFAAGAAEAERGELFDGEEVFEELRLMIEERARRE